MRVPVIVIGGETITEVPAICTAIANLSPILNLKGKSPLEKLRVYEWMNWLSGTSHTSGFGPYFCPFRWTVDSADEKTLEGIKARGLKGIIECFGDIEEKLEGIFFAVGESLTEVDAYLYIFYRWRNEMTGEYANFTRAMENLAEMEGVKKTLMAHGIESALNVKA